MSNKHYRRTQQSAPPDPRRTISVVSYVEPEQFKRECSQLVGGAMPLAFPVRKLPTAQPDSFVMLKLETTGQVVWAEVAKHEKRNGDLMAVLIPSAGPNPAKETGAVLTPSVGPNPAPAPSASPSEVGAVLIPSEGHERHKPAPSAAPAPAQAVACRTCGGERWLTLEAASSRYRAPCMKCNIAGQHPDQQVAHG